MGFKYECEMKTLKRLLSRTAEVDPLEGLNMIDAIQRLGIDHCFREEIEAILQRQYTMPTYYFHTKTRLHEIALRFRLLRQHGYFVPAGDFKLLFFFQNYAKKRMRKLIKICLCVDVFESFMDKEGKFDKEFNENIEGLTSLYEASQLCLPEEDKLEKIGNFCRHTLNNIRIIGNLDKHLASYVGNILTNPFHKSLAKLLVQRYFGFQSPNKWIHVFQQLAKLDFNRVQNLYQREISQFFG